ncbi:hypothetical protein FKP32DRAFT_1678036 [Trametes sanguinea]|nr:hypothetical protein FKP32DRAFT_1678036 [Trametes sanguinea]
MTLRTSASPQAPSRTAALGDRAQRIRERPTTVNLWRIPLSLHFLRDLFHIRANLSLFHPLRLLETGELFFVFAESFLESHGQRSKFAPDFALERSHRAAKILGARECSDVARSGAAEDAYRGVGAIMEKAETFAHGLVHGLADFALRTEEAVPLDHQEGVRSREYRTSRPALALAHLLALALVHLLALVLTLLVLAYANAVVLALSLALSHSLALAPVRLTFDLARVALSPTSLSAFKPTPSQCVSLNGAGHSNDELQLFINGESVIIWQGETVFTVQGSHFPPGMRTDYVDLAWDIQVVSDWLSLWWAKPKPKPAFSPSSSRSRSLVLAHVLILVLTLALSRPRPHARALLSSSSSSPTSSRSRSLILAHVLALALPRPRLRPHPRPSPHPRQPERLRRPP